MIIPVDPSNLLEAAAVHAAAWRESHRAFCTPEFTESHTTERQAAYLQRKMDAKSRVFLLVDEEPKGVVSVTGSLIEDLYVLSEEQGKGYGTKLLRFAAAVSTGTPSLWILENNAGARRLYERLGFFETGNRKITPGGLDEIEFALKPERMETERLILADNRISDLTPLASMPDLVYVELFYNHISDLSPLSGLTKLKDLNVCSNHISDLTPLYGLTSLERLWYSDNRFTVGDHNALCEKLPGCVCNRTVWDATADGWREHERYFWMRSFFRNSPRYK